MYSVNLRKLRLGETNKSKRRGRNRVFERQAKRSMVGKKDRRIILAMDVGNYEYYLHATRGWKMRKVRYTPKHKKAA